MNPTLPPADPATQKANLRRIAAELGFQACRVAPATAARHGDVFEKWIADGCHGDMAWLAKNTHRRLDPREVLPGAQSVIVLATSYFQGARPPGTATQPGAFARYAWGDDYHDHLEERLRDFTSYIDDVGGQHRFYVDTGPVLERDFAAESGLGWNGKSTVQIHPRLGAWFYLASVITTLPLPPDTPMGDHCGKCVRCIDACPTAAITHPRRVDARRCLSYLTIEQRGPIPMEFRQALGDRVFGCDECLSVCPWNRFAQQSAEAFVQARPFITDWNLRDFLALDEEQFRQLFQKSPVKRTKREGFLRNVCVALGNVGTQADLPALRRVVTEESSLVAEHAEWAIAQIESREASTGRPTQ